MFGKLTLDAVPLHEPIIVVTLSVVAVLGLVLAGLITKYKKWGVLWHDWITSVDHKRLGIMYIILAFVMLIRGFADALMMRSQLALATNGAEGYLPPDHYDQIFTAHGVIMIIFMAMPFMIGLMNIILPLQIGARDVAFPFLNNLSFWLAVSGAVLINLSLGVGEFAKTGWVAYPPLSGLEFSPGVGVDYYIWALQISGIGTTLTGVNDPNGEIALCTLSAFNLGALENLDELENLADLIVRALDSLLDYQDYPIAAARNATMNRRTLGVGVTNFAYYLAKNGVRYSDGSANSLVHKTFEAIQFFLLKASNQLAKEQGPCPLFNETTYSKGLLPIDTYKREVDEYCAEPLHYFWETLREDIREFGLRNSTLTALMPCETSSQITNSTNGIEPPRGFVSVKASKDGIMKQVVPEYTSLKNEYELLWSIPSNEGYLQLVGIMQKFVDQAISANTNYDPTQFPGDKVPMKQLLKDLLTAYKYGLKTLYYHNTRDGAKDEQSDSGCEGGACKL
jgi:hypothetical protein